MEEFFQMGGYAKFVWPAYFIVALFLVGLWISSQRFNRALKNKLNTLEKSERSLRREKPNET